MSKKRQSSSSVVSIMEDENLDLTNIDDEEAMLDGAERVNYMNVDISTDNIEDIITHKIENKTSLDDIYMINDEPEEGDIVYTSESDLDWNKTAVSEVIREGEFGCQVSYSIKGDSFTDVDPVLTDENNVIGNIPRYIYLKFSQDVYITEE